MLKPIFPIDNMLDIGTGAGAMLHLLAEHIKEAEGVDLSRPMLDLARVRLQNSGFHHCKVRQGDMHQLHYDDGCFSLVMMNMVLHFSGKPERAIGESVRILAPNGYLLFTDFAPHAHEHLRKEQTHRHLGFTQQQLHGFFGRHDLILQEECLIKGKAKSNQLPVSLMLFRKPA